MDNPYGEEEYDVADLLGEALDDYDDEVLGRRRGARRGRRRRAGRAMRAGRARAFTRPGYGPGIPKKSPLMPVLPGAPGISGLRVPLGFGTFTFVNAGVTTNLFTAAPQRPVRPVRLVIIVNRSAGATAEAVTIAALNVGQVSQFAGSLALPAEAFAANAEDIMISGTAAQPGIDITLTINVSAAPGVGETIAVTPVLFCDAVG
jgi:hypothetical protein